jgi:Nucleotide modification associated domain 3
MKKYSDDYVIKIYRDTLQELKIEKQKKLGGNMVRKRKVILSRKGFDNTAGGKPSAILENKLISFPIPRVDSGMFYRNLLVNDNVNYLELMKDLNIKYFSEAHLDPDIRKSTLNDRPKNWKGIFGQSGSAEAILVKNDIQKGDIFLFFGWFKQVDVIKNKYQYIKSAPDVHCIYGYLEVDEKYNLIIKNNQLPQWTLDHPHVKHSTEYIGRNAIYTATENLSFDPTKAGWGTFRYDSRLVLTKKDQPKRSVWELPDIFAEEVTKFNGKTIFTRLSNGNSQAEFIGMNNQELFISDHDEIIRWAEELINQCGSES